MSIRENALIFIPGYYGSELIDPKTGKVIWITAQEALLGRDTVAWPIPGVEIPGARALEVGNLIEQVSIVSAYGFLKKKLQTIAGDLQAKLHVVSLDWRRDPLEGARRIDRKITELRAHNVKDIYLVSHSLGSATCAYYLRYGTQDYFGAQETWDGLSQVKKAVLSAAPFGGLMVLFRNLMKGISRGGNKNLLSPLAISSFESTYYLLPKTGQDLVFTPDLESVSLGLSDPESWRKNRWGLFDEKNGLIPRFEKEIYDYVKLHIGRGNRYRELMEAPLKNRPAHDHVLYIQATGRPTVEKGVWKYSPERPNHFLYYEHEFKKDLKNRRADLVYVDGDGTVPTHSSQLPTAFQQAGTRWVRVVDEHLSCLQSNSSLFEIQKFFHR